jgi:hypothetical protein
VSANSHAMIRSIARAGAASALVALLGAAPQPVPSPSPTPNAAAEELFAKARAYWQARTDVPYLRYGALVRYLHNKHVFDNWWDAYERTSDRSVSLTPLVDPVENNRRISGVPFSIFGVTIFDTNADSEPIRIDQPLIDPTSSFGVGGRGTGVALPARGATPGPSPSDDFREITRVEVASRPYDIQIAGTEPMDGVDAIHLTLVPLEDPKLNRLRDVWLDPETFRTIRIDVQGILNGEPYDKVKWTVRYAVVDGRNYLQQMIADEPLRFGFDTVIPKFEFDFVDYHFPATVPQFTFDRPF